jgi:hypothetical protein
MDIATRQLNGSLNLQLLEGSFNVLTSRMGNNMPISSSLKRYLRLRFNGIDVLMETGTQHSTSSLQRQTPIASVATYSTPSIVSCWHGGTHPAVRTHVKPSLLQ